MNLHFIDQGRGDSCVFIHGYPFNHTMWAPQIEGLSTSMRVIAPDLPGFGQSKTTGEICTMNTMAEAILELIDSLGLRQVALCGLSMGGYVALEFFKNYPERVQRLILADTKATADTNEAKALRRTQSEKILASGMADIATAMLPKLITRENFEKKATVFSALEKMILSSSPQGASAAALGMAERADHTAHLKNIRVPVSIIVGEHDTITPLTDAMFMKNEIPGATLHIIPGSAHVANLENPEGFNKILLGYTS